MKKNSPLAAPSPFLSKRFEQMLYSALIVQVIAVSATLFVSISEHSLKNEACPILMGILFTGFCIYCFKKINMVVAGVLFIIFATFTLVNIAVNTGGLRSLAVLGFPVLLAISSLLGQNRIFILIASLIVASILFLGLSDINKWFVVDISPIGVEHFFYIYAFLIVLGFVNWTFSNDLRKALADLSIENKRVNDSQETIKELARKDFLTGLSNRFFCKECYDILLSSYSSDYERIFFYFIDLDDFKEINDSLGHLFGDELLRRVSKSITGVTKDSDIVGRLGGDEFIIILCREKGYKSQDFSNKLKSVISRKYDIFGSNIGVTASIGIAIAPDDGNDFDDLRKKSDIAMYQSKKNGKNLYEYYNKGIHDEYMRKLNFSSDFELAFNNNMLDLFYQPKVDMIDDSVVGVEALLRWEDGNPKNYQTAEFIPWIENTEVIHALGSWVLRKACQDCKHWHNKGYMIAVAINVSSKEIVRSGFFENIVEALTDSDLEGKYLEIELTERLWLSDEGIVFQQLKKIKALGVKLVIDDFGIDYSNLSYLVRFNVDIIKLDLYFVSRVCHSREHRAIIMAIIEIARVLEIGVIAEGVESLEEKNILIELGCHIGQGFYWSEAVKRDDFDQWLVEYNRQPRLTGPSQVDASPDRG